MRALILIVILVGSACSEKPKSGAPQAGSVDAGSSADSHKDEARHGDIPRRVHLQSTVVRDARIRTAAVTIEALPETVSLAGEIAPNPDAEAQVALKTPARVVSVGVREGQRVKAGDVLGVIEAPGVSEARATLASASARAQAARANADRLRSLLTDGLASGQEVRSAEAEARALESEVAAARGVLSAYGASEGSGSRVTLRSPIAGVVLQRSGVPGQSLPAEHVLVTVADLRTAYFIGRVFEKDLARVNVGASADVRLNAYPDRIFSGMVESVSRRLDPAARTVLARIRIQDEEELLRAGLYGTGLVTELAAAAEPTIVVPVSAVTRVADGEAVFVSHPDGDFELHPVRTGRTSSGKVEILSGLRKGEQVVVEGVFSVKSALLRESLTEEGE